MNTPGMKIITRMGKKAEQFPLKVTDLKIGQFAECDNGTVVIVTQDKSGDPIKAINLFNGVGAYSPESAARFRLLPMKTLTLNTDETARLIQQ